jgi:uncharacterized protein (TIGR02466 family)
MNHLQEIRPFYTSIYATKIDVDNSTIQNFILNLKNQDNGVVLSNAGGWQSQSYTNSNESCINDLLQKITSSVRAVYDDMKVGAQSAVLENYWFNVNGKYNYNIAHSHSACFYSAVYYVKYPKNSGNIHFIRSDLLRDTIPFYENNEKNWGEYWLQPSVGSLFIFPSFLKHYVTQNLTDDDDSDRISIAFNYR